MEKGYENFTFISSQNGIFLGRALLAAAMPIFTTVPAHQFGGGVWFISANLKYFLG